MAEPVIRWGLLGWSNKRTGLEFYRWDDKIIPRHGTEWGDLLVREPDFPEMEGSPVIVVVLPRSARCDQVFDATQLIRQAFSAGGDDQDG